MALVVPPPNRSRASSTCVRPALSINTLGRRRSSSLVLPVQHPESPSSAQDPPKPDSLSTSSSRPSMFSLIAEKCLQVLHVPRLHPSSSHSTSEPDLLLPLSASSQSTFGDVLNEKDASPIRWRSFHPTTHGPILLVVLLFPLSTFFVFLSLYSLPISVTWPRTLAELAELGRELQKYSQLGPAPFAHVIGVLSVTAAWKHAWSIPGSVIWNVLAGALFHPVLATLLLTFLTTVGSVIATALSAPLAPVLSRLFPRALDMTRNALEGETDLAAGSAPRSPGLAVTCQIGDILQTVASAPSPGHQTVSSLLTSPDIILKLVFLSFLSLAPILGRDKLRALISKKSLSPSAAPHPAGNERLSRWVRDWKTKMRTHSRSHARDMKILDDSVQEKAGLP
ncbi:hypothetical protein JVU11DRAFT_1591 [Chiua virens]|nr:hypothetical protein JVU11DRAFT_1591 [Chiua virens]